MEPSPRLLLTLGDPAGIGPEVVLKALADPAIATLGCQIVVVGDRRWLEATYMALRDVTDAPLADPDSLPILSVEAGEKVVVGQGDRASGEASFACLQAAIDEALAGRCAGIVTAPIAKACWQLAGRNYPGQTEVLAERSGCDRFGMLFVARSPHTDWVLRVLLATVHVPLARVPALLMPELVARKLELLQASLRQDFGLERVRVAIAGLNPHAGEGGHLGREERDWLEPLVRQWPDPNLHLVGPVPPDTLWVAPGRAWRDPAAVGEGCDAYVAMYHDQGLIPVKLLAFDEAVNVTIGLPFVRTSPDHGTAFDLAGKGIARPHSTIAAIRTAVEMICQRASASRQP